MSRSSNNIVKLPVGLNRFSRSTDDPCTPEFCEKCVFSPALKDDGMPRDQLLDLDLLVEHVGPVEAGTHLYREGDPFRAIATVREGIVKAYRVDQEGREKILNFFLPGEVIGLDAIHEDRFCSNAMAITDIKLCRFSFPQISDLARHVPSLQGKLFKLFSQNIARAELFFGDYSADERVAAFLLDVERRLPEKMQTGEFPLLMPRTDIGNYLGLAPETISRVFRRFQDQRYIHADRRTIRILDRPAMENLADPILRHS